MAKIVCPSCGVSFETTHPPGTAVECPGCALELQVPGPSAAARLASGAREGLSKWRAGRKARKAERAKAQADRYAKVQDAQETIQGAGPPQGASPVQGRIVAQATHGDPQPASAITAAETREMFRQQMAILKLIRHELRWTGLRVFGGVLLALIAFSILSAIVGVGCLGCALNR